MEPLQSALFGTLEGVTEFLPISSTFHLLFLGQLLDLTLSPFFEVFVVAIQAGAILAVLTLFGHRLLAERRLLLLLAASFLVTGLLGLIVKLLLDEQLFAQQGLMLGVFIGVGLFFIAYEHWLVKKKVVLARSLPELSLREALLVGLAQALALIPGVSRSGATIVSLMMLGFARAEAARYSFLLAIPTILTASALTLWTGRHSLLTVPESGQILLLGGLVSYAVALISLRLLIRYLESHSLALFGWYRLIVGLCLWWLLFYR